VEFPTVPPLPLAVSLIVASFPATLKFPRITFSALKSSPNPCVPSHSALAQSLPHVVPFSPPEHCFAAPSADCCRINSILSWAFHAGILEFCDAVRFAISVTFTGTVYVDVGWTFVRSRVWARARARTARKASWSVLQFLLGAQAISIRVPLGVALLEANVVLMA
jgi:hypothetical protein